MWIPGRHAASVCTAFTKSGAETSTSSVSDPESPRTLKKNTGIAIVFFPHTPTIWVQLLTPAYCSINRANTADGPSGIIILHSSFFPEIPLLVTPCFLWCDRGPWPRPSRTLSDTGRSSRSRCLVYRQASQKDLPLSCALLTLSTRRFHGTRLWRRCRGEVKRRRSARTARAELRPAAPMIPPPGWAPAPQRYRCAIGVR